ncbi:MAG TPA: PEP-CTERM sorting domain-containing protein, partial [Humisphaera sp.]
GNPASSKQAVHGPVALAAGPAPAAPTSAAGTAPAESMIATGPSQAAGTADAGGDPWATGLAMGGGDPTAKFDPVGNASSMTTPPDFGLSGTAPGIFAGTDLGLGPSSMIPTNPDPIPEPTGVAVFAAAAAVGLLARRRRAGRRA